MSMLDPASKSKSTASIFPAITAQCNAVFFWTLSTALREGLNFRRNLVGSGLGEKQTQVTNQLEKRELKDIYFPPQKKIFKKLNNTTASSCFHHHFIDGWRERAW